MEDYDIIVVGGGPAGASFAIYMGKKGYNVLLLDKASFPRDKICGDGISGKSLRVLRELGLDVPIEKGDHAKMYGVTFSSPKGVVVSIYYPQESPTTVGELLTSRSIQSGNASTEGERGGTRMSARSSVSAPIPTAGALRVPSGYCCRREVFDNAIFQEAKKHATVMEKFMVNDLVMENGYVKGVKGMDLNAKPQQEKTFRAKLVVGADGATSLVAKKLGLDGVDDKHLVVAIRAYYEGVTGLGDTIEIHFIDSVLPGYFWIFPLENGKANVGIGMLATDMKKKKTSLNDAMMNALKEPMFEERFKNAKQLTPIKGWNLPLGSKRRKNHGNGFLLLGDAASMIDPFTGEGIGNALYGSRLAADAADRALKANDVSEKMLGEYEQAVRKEIDPELRSSYNLQKAGKFKFLLNLMVDKAARSSEVREVLSGTLTDYANKNVLISPMFILRVLFA